MSNNIPCPNCSTLIAVKTEEFLKGETFTCPTCSNKLGIEEETDLDRDSNKLEEFKKFTKLKKEKTSLIPCPDCGTAIRFFPKDLITGGSIACPKCKSTLSLQG